MKAEERHQLKENDLASWMRYGLPLFLKDNGSYILLVVALCFLGYQLYNMYERKQANLRITAWNEFFNAGTAENPSLKLRSVIETYDIPRLRSMAYLQLGTYYDAFPLSPEQMRAMKTTKTEALTTSGDAFQDALKVDSEDNLIAAKATLGLAAVLEDRGDWPAARKQYESMTDPKGRFANTPFADIAAMRLASLGNRERAPRLADRMPIATRPGPEFRMPGPMGPAAPETPAAGPGALPEIQGMFAPAETAPAGTAAPANKEGATAPSVLPEAAAATAPAAHP